jgi:hypothetical protein
MDKCKNCSARGDKTWCEGSDCSVKVSWYADELRTELAKAKENTCGLCNMFERDDCRSEKVTLRAELAQAKATIEGLREVAAAAERYMTEKGVSHEYPVMINLRSAINSSGGGGDD